MDGSSDTVVVFGAFPKWHYKTVSSGDVFKSQKVGLDFYARWFEWDDYIVTDYTAWG